MDTNKDSVEMRILRHIDANGPASSVELAKLTSVGIETITDILRDGVRQRFIGREYDEDHCCVVYTIAARGRNALADDNAANAPRPKTKEQLLLERVEELDSKLRLAENALQASNALLTELVNQPEESGPYMVSVNDTMASPKEFSDVADAKAFAERHVNVMNQGTIRVLRLVDTLAINTASMTTAVWASAEQEMNKACNEQCGHCSEATCGN